MKTARIRVTWFDTGGPVFDISGNLYTTWDRYGVEGVAGGGMVWLCGRVRMRHGRATSLHGSGRLRALSVIDTGSGR